VADGKDKAPTRTKTQIEADLKVARDRLGDSVEDLINQVHPNRLKQRQIAKLKNLATAELDNAKSQVINPDGSPRTDRLVIIGGAVAGLITFLVVVRTLVNKAKRRSSR